MKFSSGGGVRTRDLGLMKDKAADTTPISISNLHHKSNSLAPQLAPEAENQPIDPGLTQLIAAWPALPPHIRAAVLALVESVSYR